MLSTHIYQLIAAERSCRSSNAIQRCWYKIDEEAIASLYLLFWIVVYCGSSFEPAMILEPEIRPHLIYILTQLKSTSRGLLVSLWIIW